MLKKKRKPLSFLVFFLAFWGLLIFLQKAVAHQKFLNLSEYLLQQSYEKDSLSMHFAFQNPKEFGLNDSVTSLPFYQKESYLQEADKTQEIQIKLRKIKKSHLSKSEQNTYDILSRYLDQKAKGASFTYFEQPLSPTSGIHISLPVLLAEYSIACEQDLFDYFSLLKQLPAYFSSLLAYEQDKANAGKFFSTKDCEQVISQCKHLSSKDGQAIFRACFEKQLKKLYAVDSKEYTLYCKKQAAVFCDYIAPAYQNLANGLHQLLPFANPQLGLCQYPNGKEYYEYHLANVIGTDKTRKQLQMLLQKRYQLLYQKFCALKKEYTPSMQHACPTNRNLNVYLQELSKQFQDDFGKLGKTSAITLTQIPESLSDYTAPAYYFLPRLTICLPGHIDQIENIIYYGKQAYNDPIGLFTTLAHEGYPGHMYQNLFFINSQGVSKNNILRYRLDFPGYQEGWAMYVELLAYDKAADFFHQNPTYCQLLKLSREIQICILCYLDIEIHTNNATLTDVAKTLSKIGVKDPEAIQSTYRYLVNEPGTYLKYYIGYLEVLSLKKAYQKYCQQNKIPYQDLAFHTFFLTHGPDTFPHIRKCIESLP